MYQCSQKGASHQSDKIFYTSLFGSILLVILTGFSWALINMPALLIFDMSDVQKCPALTRNPSANMSNVVKIFSWTLYILYSIYNYNLSSTAVSEKINFKQYLFCKYIILLSGYDHDNQTNHFYVRNPWVILGVGGLPVSWRKLILYTHIICNSAITSVLRHYHGYNGLWYDRSTGITRTDLLSHT